MRDIAIAILMITVFLSLLLIEIVELDDHNVYQVQKKLKELGYDPGLAYGIWGKKTDRL